MSSGAALVASVISEYASNLEKKQRNLLKRKAKLDSYRAIRDGNGTLTADQLKAVSDYDSVCLQIETIKESVNLINDLQTKVTETVKDNEARLLAQRDDFAINAIRKVVPILDLLVKSQSPVAKDSIIKASSIKEFKMLEQAAKTMHVRLPPTFKHDVVDSTNWFQAPAEFLFKLATASQEPINGKPGKSKSATFAELRKYCYDMQSHEDVRSTLNSLNQVPRSTLSVHEEPQHAPVQQPAKSMPVSNLAEQAKTNGSKPLAATSLQQADVILKEVINPLKSDYIFVQPAVYSTPYQFMGPEHDLTHINAPSVTEVEKALVTNTEAKPVAPPKPVEHVQPVVQTQTSVNTATEKVKQKPQHHQPPADHKTSQQHQQQQPQEKPKAPESQPPSFQALMDSQIAEQKESSEEIRNQPKTWADRVRGSKSAPVSKPKPAAPAAQTNSKPAPVTAAAAAINEPTTNGHRSQHEQPRPKSSGQHREPREHRPPRSGFNKEGDGERNNENRTGHPPRGGFRGNGRGRGNGAPFRGGRGRGGQRGSFHRGGFDGHSSFSRQQNGDSDA